MGCWVISTSIFGLILYLESLGGNEYDFDLHIFFSGGSGFGGLTLKAQSMCLGRNHQSGKQQ